LDDGRLTDANGRTVDFSNTIVVMTSNVGAQELRDRKFAGFGTTADSDTQDYDTIRSTMMKELKETFRPEFINHVDDIIVLHSLERVHQTEIVSLMIEQLQERLADHNINIELSDKAKEQNTENEYDPENGTCPLAHSIQKNIENTLSES